MSAIATLSTRDQTEYTISDLSCLYRLSLRSLRFYEQIGLLKPRRYGTQRIYSVNDKIRLELILTGKRLKLSLREIERLLEDNVHSNNLVSLLDTKEIAQRIEILEDQRNAVVYAIDELNDALRRVAETT